MKISSAKIIKILLILCFSLVLNHCTYKVTKPKELNCVVPQPVCKNQDWKGVALDTSRTMADQLGYYYAIKPVQFYNFKAEKFDVFFNTGSSGYVTFKDTSKYQKVRTFLLSFADRIEPKVEIPSPINGHFGNLFQSASNVVFAGNLDQQSKYYLGNLNGIKRVDLNGIIGQSRLYEANISGTNISGQKLINKIDTLKNTNWESYPHIAFGGKILFFASDREGTSGGSDLWFSVKLSNGFSEPINCGQNVNTECDDISPFVSPDGKSLYFSSIGHQSVGGYDIFASKISDDFLAKVNLDNLNDEDRAKAIKKISSNIDQLFGKPLNQRNPLNTIYNEINPSCNGNCDSLLYYASNQPNALNTSEGFEIYVREKIHIKNIEFGSKRVEKVEDINVKEAEYVPATNIDIPVMEIAEKPKDTAVTPIKVVEPEVKQPIIQTFKIEGKVLKENSLEPIQNAEITVKTTETKEITKKTQSDKDGNYSLELPKGEEMEIVAQFEDLFYDSYKVKVEKNDTTSIVKRSLALPVIFNLRVNFPYDEFKVPYKYTLDSNGIETKNEWQNEIDNLAQNILKSLDKLERIKLVGHTDDIGSVEYNKRLGQNRVEFVVTELLKRKIPANLISTRSAGKLEPITMKQGEDMDIYRKRLRRVTIEKIYKKK